MDGKSLRISFPAGTNLPHNTIAEDGDESSLEDSRESVEDDDLSSTSSPRKIPVAVFH